MIRLPRAPTRADPTDIVFDEPLPPEFESHTYEGGRRFDLHDLRYATLRAPDAGGATFLALADGVDGWIRCDLPEPIASNSLLMQAQKSGPLHATAGDVSVRIDWTRPSNLATLRRLEWVRSDDPTPRRLRGVLGLTTKATAGDRTLMTSSSLRWRVADDIDAVDLAMVVLAGSLYG